MPHRSGIAARRLRTRLQLDGCCAGGRPKTALRRTDPDGMAETRFCTPRSLRKRPSCLKSGARFPVGAVWHPAFAQVEGPPVRARDFRARKIKHKGHFRSERGRKMRLPRKAVGDVYLGAVFAEGGGRDGRRRGFRTTSRRDRPSRTSASRPRLAVFRHSAIHVCRDRLQYGRVCRDRLQCDTCLPGSAAVRYMFAGIGHSAGGFAGIGHSADGFADFRYSANGFAEICHSARQIPSLWPIPANRPALW